MHGTAWFFLVLPGPSATRRTEVGRSVSVQHPVQVLYIGGYSRNGSTLLGALLAQRSGAVSGGELGQLFSWAAQERPCTCGLLLSDCPFWGPVIACVEKDTEMSMEALAIACEAAERGKSEPRIWRRAWGSTMNELRELHGVQQIIDSSKTARGRQRMLLLASLERVDICLLVHVQRSWGGVMHSRREGSNVLLEDGQQSGFSTIAALRAVVGWTRANRAAARQGTRVPYRRVRYDALAADPEQTIDAMIAAAGWESAGSGSESLKPGQERVAHAIGANRVLRSG